MNLLWRVGLLAIEIIKCDHSHDKQEAMISNNALASVIQKKHSNIYKLSPYRIMIMMMMMMMMILLLLLIIIICFFKSNETEVEHSKSYKSQVREA